MLHRASEGGASSPLLRRAKGEKQVEYLDLDLHTGRSTPTRQVGGRWPNIFMFTWPLQVTNTLYFMFFLSANVTTLCFPHVTRVPAGRSDAHPKAGQASLSREEERKSAHEASVRVLTMWWWIPNGRKPSRTPGKHGMMGECRLKRRKPNRRRRTPHGRMNNFTWLE